MTHLINSGLNPPSIDVNSKAHKWSRLRQSEDDVPHRFATTTIQEKKRDLQKSIQLLALKEQERKVLCQRLLMYGPVVSLARKGTCSRLTVDTIEWMAIFSWPWCICPCSLHPFAVHSICPIIDRHFPKWLECRRRNPCKTTKCFSEQHHASWREGIRPDERYDRCPSWAGPYHRCALVAIRWWNDVNHCISPVVSPSLYLYCSSFHT